MCLRTLLSLGCDNTTTIHLLELIFKQLDVTEQLLQGVLPPVKYEVSSQLTVQIIHLCPHGEENGVLCSCL